MMPEAALTLAILGATIVLLVSDRLRLDVVAMMSLLAPTLSAFMSSTGTVAILLPVVGTVALKRGIAPARLLMPVGLPLQLLVLATTVIVVPLVWGF
ncbi:hypothetical protein [Sorangium sp. So ce128]|uniref:hypothetical protein n=1 Tax=Sorangium sp. So ce128 TaxID=3133281 RepID=UPI003F63D785